MYIHINHSKVHMAIGAAISGGAIAAFLVYLYREEIKEAVKSAYDSCVDYSYSQLDIDIKIQSKCLFAIKEEIMKERRSRYNVRDGVEKPEYHLANGKYTITYSNKYIFISVTDDQVNISVFWEDIDFLIGFMDSIYREHCAPDKVILFYNLNEGKWNFPVFRRPRKLENIKQTSDMKKVLDDVDQFLKNKDKYEENGMPYRKGYLLEGPTGVGKSTIIEILAMQYNKSVYLVFLNTLNMTDALLINLISTIPPYSIIVIEEIEKQLETLKKNGNNMVSEGGILTALDGPQRVSYGSIIIITANNLDMLSRELKTPLLRPGRIDKHFILNEKI